MRRRRILFICEGNLHRSPTAEQLYADTPSIRTKSAGVSALARVQVTEELLVWADVVCVMQKQLRKVVQERFPGVVSEEKWLCLNVPDEFQRGQAELLALLTQQLTPSLGPPDAGHNLTLLPEPFAETPPKQDSP
jgi:predicted protein tyrosine phosphatase